MPPHCSLFTSVARRNWEEAILYSSSWILSSACSNMLLTPSSEFFISVTVLYSSRISFLFPFRFFLSLFIDISISYINFLAFSTSHFCSLRIFKMVALKYLSSISVIRFFSGTVSVHFFPLRMGHIFLIFVCLVIFVLLLLKTGHLNLIM